MKFTYLKGIIKNPIRKNLRKPRVLWTIAAILLLSGLTITLMSSRLAADQAAADATKAASNGQSYKGQVENSKGEPLNGRNPANQSQTSLASAASSPAGNGRRTDTPAKDVKGDQNHKTTYSDTYGDPKKTGINSAGCFVDYGIPGEQCMPAGMADKDGKLTCSAVHMHFPEGLKVSGTDRFNLDTNHDGIACNSGD
jgi:hypothetical protein